jgi:AcrR family transcriptional regulator
LGRPPSSNSAETRQRILDVARSAFALRGYETTTNRGLGADVGITSGAIYHYYGSKLDLYLAVHADVQRRVYTRFAEAVASAATFREQLEAVLDEAHLMNEEDPTLAQFLGAVRVDMRRHTELAAALQQSAHQRDQFFDHIVDVGLRTGEIRPEDQRAVSAFLTTIIIGLTDAMSSDQDLHSQAVDGIKALLKGRLLQPISAVRAP